MSKDKNKFITIIILLAITFTILFAFSSLDLSNNNLNANTGGNSNTPPTQQPPFTYENSRSSEFSNIVYENNIGGSEDDELCQVYVLDFYYLIGNTKSSNYYFEKNNQTNFFIAKVNKSGNVFSLCTSQSISQYYDSLLTGFGIYILSHNPSSNTSFLHYYEFATSSLHEIMQWQNFEAQKIIRNDTIIITGIKNNKLISYFYNINNNEWKSNSTKINANNILFSAPYVNGSLLFINNANNFSIYQINENTYNMLYHVNGYELLDFQINNFGYFLVLSNEFKHITQFVTNSFELSSQYNLQLFKAEINLLNLNNNFYLITPQQNGNALINIYSIKGDLVFNIELNYATTKLLGSTQNSNFAILAFSTTENNLLFLTVNKLTSVINETLISFSKTTHNIFMEEEYNNTLIIFGTVNNKNTLVTNSYGKNDVFIFKCYNY